MSDLTSGPAPGTAQPQVSVEGLARSFGGVPAVRDVSFTVGTGEIHALCGHNGAGKSTVVKMLSGQIAPDSGRILIDGRPVQLGSRQAALRLGIALVDQELSVVPALSVLDNLMLGDIAAPLVNRRRAAARYQQVLRDVGLERVSPDQPLSSLSIGERQLVEIARALSQNARLVILDEPTAALGVEQTAQVLDLVKRLRDRGLAVMVISHNLADVRAVSDRIVVLRLGRNAGDFRTADTSQEAIVAAITGLEDTTWSQ